MPTGKVLKLIFCNTLVNRHDKEPINSNFECGWHRGLALPPIDKIVEKGMSFGTRTFCSFLCFVPFVHAGIMAVSVSYRWKTFSSECIGTELAWKMLAESLAKRNVFLVAILTWISIISI